MHDSTLDAGNLATMSSRRMRVTELKQRVQRREYAVDCRAVAEALIARQMRCWNPSSARGPVRSHSTSPGSPSATRPTG